MPAPSLAELIEPSRTAVLLQELQNGVVGPDGLFTGLVEACEEVGVVGNTAALARAARDVDVPVIHATAENLPGDFGANRNARLFAAARAAGGHNRPGTDSVQPVAELHEAGDLVLPRYHGLSPLTGAQLDPLLRNQGIQTIVVAGVSLNVAIPNVVFDAVNRAYQVVVVTDAVAGTPVAYGEAVVANTLAVVATLAPTADIAASWGDG
ncbi:MAG: isochorismatase family cysteine hydrolase [Acidimicrobiales bacterium]|nr:isochorismatase family cysteine hydrolase [Acidimicrobiales bacterium]